MYRKQVRRRRAILAALVIVSFLLLTFTFGEGSNSVQRVVGTALGPVEEGVTRALKPARDLLNWFDETFEARGENERLREELEQAREMAVAGEAARAENEQLRDMAGLRESGTIPEDYEPVTTRVIARSPSNWTSTVTVDAGSGAGVSERDPVISGDGLVGQVLSVNPSSSVVMLITDPSSRVSGRILPDGVQGILQPEVGNPQGLVLSFLDRSGEIEEGDVVVTAGWRTEERASRFPPNIPVGEVERAPLIEQEAAEQVFVRPFADMSRLDMLQILTGGPRQ